MRLLALALIAALLCSVADGHASAAATAKAGIGLNRPTPATTMTVGALRVEKYGSGEPAIILIPGVACGTWVWDSVIRNFSPLHAVYALTLPGFDGTPAAKPPLLDGADAAVWQLIANEHLTRPVIVGHSLGGALAIRLAEEHADALRGIVSIDGLPVFPTMSQMTADQRQKSADMIAESIRGSTPQQFAQYEERTIAALVTDPAAAKQIAVLAAKSDTGAVAAYVSEDYALDLRSNLAKVIAPMLVLVPVPKELPPGYPDFLRSLTPDALTMTLVGFDQGLFAGAPHVQMLPIADARHFAMIDQPDAVNKALADFISGLK